MSIAVPAPPATLDDLLKVEGKAEFVAGRIIRFMPSGDAPCTVAFEIAVRLREHAKAGGRGKAYSDGIGFALPAPLRNGRQSFSPDAAFYSGPPAANKMRIVTGVPELAVEVRSENDYGPKAEREMADKRADYFEAGTLVVWDVDPLAETVARYTTADPLTPVVFRRGEVADAEPALPGWRLPVDDLFD
jgi:Uma2 family endonuclease